MCCHWGWHCIQGSLIFGRSHPYVLYLWHTWRYLGEVVVIVVVVITAVVVSHCVVVVVVVVVVFVVENDV
jgi:hypothetical protein